MFTLFRDLLERWEAETLNRALGRDKQEPASPPTEKDLTDFKPYQMLVKAYPDLERQLKLAWNGDSRAMGKKEPESEYIFPKLLKTENLEKYQKGFSVNNETMRCVKELYDLFVQKFQIKDRKRNGWFSY